MESSHTVSFAGLPPVLATPWLIWFLEHAALELLAAHLEDDEISVGTAIEWEHLAPAPLGATVRCQARVIHVDGPQITFQIEAHDEQDRLGRGLHKRRVVSASRLARRIERKGRG